MLPSAEAPGAFSKELGGVVGKGNLMGPSQTRHFEQRTCRS